MDVAQQETQQRLGILGGTFDPIHIGHLCLAQAALEELHLSQILFMPAARPPHKQDRAVTSAQARMEMVQRAVADNPAFAVSDLELARSGPSYTVGTLAQLGRLYPDYQLVLIIGLDSLLDMASWHRPEEILQSSHVAVAARPGFSFQDIEARLGSLFERYRSRIHFFSAPLLDISSTRLRELVRRGRSIRYLTPDEVADFVRREGLYQEGNEGE
ncbi:MAG: nicotinate-nucleotide adenylyltransferase [Firmicutes bacterium]|nr:nicotinate-nucleotide adenylyltransferase [Bacillota bacterium]